MPSSVPSRKPSRSRVAVQAALLMVVWLLLSGHYDPFHVALGVLSVALVLYINRRIRALPISDGGVPSRGRLRLLRLLAYFVWLPIQILLAAVHVARVVMSRRMPLEPRLVRFRSDQPNAFAQMILGNSITLTPGTITVDVEGDEFLVHSLTAGTTAGLLDETMQRKVARLFEDEPGSMVFDVVVEGGEG